MIDGRLVQTSKQQELYFYPKSLAVANFLGIKNILEGKYKEERENEFLIYVPALEKTIIVLKRKKFPSFEKEKKVYIGIRSDEVMYIRKDRELKYSENIFSGHITEIYRKESLSKIFFKVKSVEFEITMNYGILRKLGLKVGSTGEILLKKEAFFVADFN